MNIDFSDKIKNLKEKDVLNKPFPVADGGYALFAKNEKGNFVRMLFSNQDHIKQYLNNAGYDWGNEGKDEFRNFDCLNRLLTVMPELSEVETVAADPQWDPDAKPETLHEKENLNDSARKMEDMPDLAVELREVDHPIGYDDRTHASEEKDYSGLWKKVSAFNQRSLMGMNKFLPGDKVENVNPDCKHFGSIGTIAYVKDVMGKQLWASEDSKAMEREQVAGCVFGYITENEGKNWMRGDTLEKTPDQLELIEAMPKLI